MADIVRNTPYCGSNYTTKATRNREAGDDCLTKFQHWAQTSTAAYRIPKFAATTTKIATEVVKYSGGSAFIVQSLGDTGNVLGGIANATSFAACFVAVPAAVKSVKKLTEGDVTGKKILDVFNKVADAVAFVAYSTLLFIRSEPAKVVGDVAGVVADGTGVIQKASDLHQAINIAANPNITNENIRTGLKSHIKLKWIELSKEVTALATGILGLLGLMLGGAIVPAVILLTISLASTILAITSHFYKANMAQNITFTPQRA